MPKAEAVKKLLLFIVVEISKLKLRELRWNTKAAHRDIAL